MVVKMCFYLMFVLLILSVRFSVGATLFSDAVEHYCRDTVCTTTNIKCCLVHNHQVWIFIYLVDIYYNILNIEPLIEYLILKMLQNMQEYIILFCKIVATGMFSEPGLAK